MKSKTLSFLAAFVAMTTLAFAQEPAPVAEPSEAPAAEATVAVAEAAAPAAEVPAAEPAPAVEVAPEAVLPVLSSAIAKASAATEEAVATLSATNDAALVAIAKLREKWRADESFVEKADKARNAVTNVVQTVEASLDQAKDPVRMVSNAVDRAVVQIGAERDEALGKIAAARKDLDKEVWKRENWLGRFSTFVDHVDGKVWGTTFSIGKYPVPCLIVLILFGGILLTIRLGGMQIWRLPRALRYMVRNEDGGHGEVTSFAALCTALSATIGTGNIVGVATAVVAGGPGALFWMWLAALFGMATKYAEGLLAVKYRSHDPETGHVLGGPFYYIERGMGRRWKPLAVLFAVFGAIAGLMGIGTFTQVHSISGAVTNYFDPNAEHMVTILSNEYSWMTVLSSFALAVLVGLVLIGGLKRIANVSEKVIPLMVVIYVVFAGVLVLCNASAVPVALAKVFRGAFGAETAGRAAFGGAIGAIVMAMQKGVARGIFSNEAGLGSAPIAAAAAQTREPVRQGLVSMTGTFLDTIVVCSMTGLALVIAGFGSLSGSEAEGAAATMEAFTKGLPFLPPLFVKFVLMTSLVLFGFTTILGWDYYSERCLEYLTKGNMKPVLVYRWLYILAVFIGPFMTIDAVWGLADVFNGLMAIPNMIALIVLSGVVSKETKSYFRRLKAGEIKE